MAKHRYIPFPSTPTSYQMTVDVPDHEILLVFNGDEEALEFRSWLSGPGWKNFETWRASFNRPG